MAAEHFAIGPESVGALDQDLSLIVSPDYETPADRIQRQLIIAERPQTERVTAKTIARYYQLDTTDIDEPPAWIPGALARMILRETNDLAALTDTLDLSTQAADPEGQAISYALGAVPAGLTAALGVGHQAHILTVTYPAQQANPPTDLSYAIPLWLEQPLGTKIAGTDRSLPVRVLRYAPQPIHTSYATPRHQGRLYIDAGDTYREVTLNDWIQNHDRRPLRIGHGTGYAHAWSDQIASYTIGDTAGTYSLRATRADPYPGGTRTSNIQIRVQTDDNGDTSTAFLNFLLRVEPPPPGT